MTTHRKLIQFVAVAALIANLPAQAQVLGGNLGGNIGGALSGGLGSINGSGAANGAGQGTFDTGGAFGRIHDAGEHTGSRIRDVAGNAGDSARTGTSRLRDTGTGSVAASHQVTAKAQKQVAEKGSEPSPAAASQAAPSSGLLGSADGSATANGALAGSMQKDVMGKSIAADGESSHSASADRSGLAASSSQQANVKAGPKETAVATPAP